MRSRYEDHCTSVLVLLISPQLSWHVPSEEEIDFVLEVFRDIVEPTLTMLEALLEDGVPLVSSYVRLRAELPQGVIRDAVWRNDFCR
jgi:proteasome activator subunit 4